MVFKMPHLCVDGNRLQDRTEGGLLLTLSCVRLCATPWTVVHQDPLSTGFSRQEHCSGLPFPSPGELPHPGIEPVSPTLAGGFFTTEPPGGSRGRPCRINSLSRGWQTFSVQGQVIKYFRHYRMYGLLHNYSTMQRAAEAATKGWLCSSKT